MKRRLTKLVLFLLLGAIVNVAVAWGCAVWQPWPNEWYRLLKEGHTSEGLGFRDWTVKVWRSPAWARVLSRWTARADSSILSEQESQAEKLLPSWAQCAHPSIDFAPRTIVLYFVEARGWPFLAMRSKWETKGRAGSPGWVSGRVQVISGYLILSDRSIPWDVENPRVIPLRPIWPGFAINTVFYAAILWMPFAPFQLRRYVRVKRGHCVKCGYDLRGVEHEVCPECGVEV